MSGQRMAPAWPLRAAACTLLAASLAGTPVAVPAQATAARADPAAWDYRLSARALAPGVWVVDGDNDDFSPANGCNIINTGFIATGAGVLVVNTGPSRRYGEQLRRLIARTTPEPVLRVLHLNLHPDYFLGNQAFADVPRQASALTRAGIQREAAGYESNLYRLCGDWMAGTESLAPDDTFDTAAGSGEFRLGSRSFEWLVLQGHTGSDLVLHDRNSGVLFTGGLVFANRVPTTPHAKVADWLQSLQRLEAWPAWARATAVVPSHGPVHAGAMGLQQTRRYLQWLDRAFTRAAEQGLDMNELLRMPVPQEFRSWAAFRTEYVRNVAHLYPAYERRVLDR